MACRTRRGGATGGRLNASTACAGMHKQQHNVGRWGTRTQRQHHCDRATSASRRRSRLQRQPLDAQQPSEHSHQQSADRNEPERHANRIRCPRPR
eukprot:scaffold3121_cov365-Prasinococcus_capsulatus_cf.AAC.7